MKLKSISALLTASATLAVMVTAATFAIQGSLAQAATPKAVPHAAKSTVISTRKTSLGTVLVGPNGRTLYLWEADSRNHSNCSSSCAQAWPKLMLSGKLKAAGGVKSKLLGSIASSKGRQVTYDGHPLYYFVDDTSKCQTTGEGSTGFGAAWYVVSTAGAAIKH
jgi:predicted lipoprotein with Yx(FWY)xxD motif